MCVSHLFHALGRSTGPVAGWPLNSAINPFKYNTARRSRADVVCKQIMHTDRGRGTKTAKTGALLFLAQLPPPRRHGRGGPWVEDGARRMARSNLPFAPLLEVAVAEKKHAWYIRIRRLVWGWRSASVALGPNRDLQTEPPPAVCAWPYQAHSALGTLRIVGLQDCASAHRLGFHLVLFVPSLLVAPWPRLVAPQGN